jgi:hypothetical protein
MAEGFSPSDRAPLLAKQSAAHIPILHPVFIPYIPRHSSVPPESPFHSKAARQMK